LSGEYVERLKRSYLPYSKNIKCFYLLTKP